LNKVEANVKLGPFTHANGDGEEIMAVEKALLEHPDVQAEIAKLKLPEGTVVVADPWIYGMPAASTALECLFLLILQRV
jgi:primary-amine oxidase